MKLVIISDTHNKHWQLTSVPNGDVLIHCGDITDRGELEQLMSFDNWLATLPHPNKIVIGGNHDITLGMNATLGKELLKHATYLEDEGIEIDGVKFWGSPTNICPGNWAFNDKQEERMSKVPEGTDVLITHGPPKGVLDELGVKWNYDKIGDPLVLEASKRVKPKVHCFGHVHEAYGTMEEGGIKYFNAAMCNEFNVMSMDGKLLRTPHVVEI